MLHKVIRFIYTWFLKPRYIYQYPLEYLIDKSKNIKVLMLDDEIEFLDGIAITERLNNLIEKRKSSKWVLFVCLIDKEVIAYSFLHVPSEIEWLDSMPTFPGESRLCSTFVEPKYRGQRIRGALMEHQKKYCLDNDLRLFSIIEKTNYASRKSTERQGGYIRRRNYLVKFLKRNVFSIILNPLEIHLLVGAKRASR